MTNFGMVERIEFMCSPDVNKVVANPNPKVVIYICVSSDVSKVVANSKEISQCTHADPRCTASCIAVTIAVSDGWNMPPCLRVDDTTCC